MRIGLDIVTSPSRCKIIGIRLSVFFVLSVIDFDIATTQSAQQCNNIPTFHRKTYLVYLHQSTCVIFFKQWKIQ